MAEGNLDGSLLKADGRDEIRAIVDALARFKESLLGSWAIEAATAGRLDVEDQRKAAMHQMANSVEQAVGRALGTVPSAAGNLRHSAQRLTATADETAQPWPPTKPPSTLPPSHRRPRSSARRFRRSPGRSPDRRGLPGQRCPKLPRPPRWSRI